MTKITVEHDSINGNLFNKHFNAKEAIADYGFELHKKRYIALKLISATPNIRPYFILGLDEITLNSIIGLVNKNTPELLIPHTAFDRSSVQNSDVLKLVPTKLKQYLLDIKYRDYIGTDAFSIFKPEEREQLIKNNAPVWCKNHNKVVSLWAKTLPAYGKPVEISKSQYFEAILYNSKPPNYRRPFFRV